MTGMHLVNASVKIKAEPHKLHDCSAYKEEKVLQLKLSTDASVIIQRWNLLPSRLLTWDRELPAKYHFQCLLPALRFRVTFEDLDEHLMIRKQCTYNTNSSIPFFHWQTKPGIQSLTIQSSTASCVVVVVAFITTVIIIQILRSNIHSCSTLHSFQFVPF